MAKRKRSESLSDFEDAAANSDDSFTEAPKKKRKPAKAKIPAKPKRTGKAITKPDIDADAIIGTAVPHNKSLHVLDDGAEICDALLGWYAGVHATRGMPWRKPFNAGLDMVARAQRAYEVWVSEIMLQQTQVATVIPYYNSWMARFPTIRELATSPIDDVNAIWKGLGYYSRASRLLDGAQKAVAEYGGLLPDNARDMEKNIPGVGRYTAGAICSIAYGERVPVLDGNVHRLLSRLLALHASPKAKSTLDILWEAADVIVKTEPASDASDMVSKRNPGDINQALIELGSTVCKVRAPDCEACPLSSKCAAYQLNSGASDEPDMEDLCILCEPLIKAGVTAYPMKVERKKSREETDLVSVVEWSSTQRPDERFFLLVRRPDEGLLAGLYEFPADANVPGTLTPGRSVDLSYARLCKLLQDSIMPYQKDSQAYGDDERYKISHVKPAGDVLHIFSHIRKTYRVQWVKLSGGIRPPTFVVAKGKAAGGDKPALVWSPLAEVEAANIGTGVVKVWKLVQKLWK